MAVVTTTALPPPELRSKGQPTAGREIRRRTYLAREKVRDEGARLTCPAASLVAVGGPQGIIVRCGVERSHITERADPSSLLSFCMGDYRACGSWRAEKERIWAGKLPLVGENEGV